MRFATAHHRSTLAVCTERVRIIGRHEDRRIAPHFAQAWNVTENEFVAVTASRIPCTYIFGSRSCALKTSTPRQFQSCMLTYRGPS